MIRRWVVTVALVSTGTAAQAQFEGAIEGTFKAFAKHSLFMAIPLESKGTSNPLASSGFNPQLPRRDQTPAPPPPGPDERYILRIVRPAGKVVGQGSEIEMTGGVVALYQGYRMEADSVRGNKASQVYILDGHAKLVGSDVTLNARKIIVDYQNQTYETFDSDSDLRPSLVGGVLLSDLYVRAQHSSGTRTDQYIDYGHLTTCNYDDPHYEFVARYTEVKFQKWIKFHDLDVVLLNHPILHVGDIALPLDNRDYQNLPTFGQNPYEGYFVKTRYGVPLKGDQVLYTRVDEMTRVGQGLGFDYTYDHETGKNPSAGTLSVYGVTAARSLDIEETHMGKFRWGTLQLQNSYQNNDYLTAPGSVLLSSRFVMSLPQRGATTTISGSLFDNSSTGFDSKQDSLGVSDSRQFGHNIRTQTQVNYTANESLFSGTGSPSSDIKRDQIDINFQADDDLRQAIARLQYQRSVPIGTIQNFFNYGDRTPVFSLESDGSRLISPNFNRAFPFRTSVSIGEFADPHTQTSVTRDYFDFSFNKQGNAAAHSETDVNGLFRQGLYSDGTAQYVLGFGAAYTYRFTKETSFNLRYNYLRPEGYSPIGVDQTGKTNLVTEDLSVRVARPLLLGVQSGYDAIQLEQDSTPWQPVGLRAEYTPTKYVLARALGTYDPFYKGFANFRFDMTWRPGATYVGLGARYDNTRHTWAQANLFVQALKWGRLKTDLALSFNGYSDQFDSRQISFTYDLHDAELVFQVIDNPIGFNSGTQYVLFLRLKALPFSNPFGVGTRGQPIGTGTGVGY